MSILERVMAHLCLTSLTGDGKETSFTHCFLERKPCSTLAVVRNSQE